MVFSEHPRAVVIVMAMGKPFRKFTHMLTPDIPLLKSFNLSTRARLADLRVVVNGANRKEIISYQAKARVVDDVPLAATEPAAPADMESNEDLYLTGPHLS
jgi:hypothetical protein